METLNFAVFPSTQKTIKVLEDPGHDDGAHTYVVNESLGFKDGQALYVNTTQTLRFVRKNDDGTIDPGMQSEQLALVLMDRAEKLNKRFPSDQNEKMIAGLKMFLDACRERVEDRIKRGVMGDLKL